MFTTHKRIPLVLAALLLLDAAAVRYVVAYSPGVGYQCQNTGALDCKGCLKLLSTGWYIDINENCKKCVYIGDEDSSCDQAYDFCWQCHAPYQYTEYYDPYCNVQIMPMNYCPAYYQCDQCK